MWNFDEEDKEYQDSLKELQIDEVLMFNNEVPKVFNSDIIIDVIFSSNNPMQKKIGKK